MNQTPSDIATLTRDAMAALRQGQADSARDLFQQATQAHAGDASLWLGLAFANARLGEDQPTLDAIDKALELEPRSLRALIFKGDHHDQQGRSRKAMVFYQAALKVAAQAESIPEDVRGGLGRAQENVRRYAAEYEDYLLGRLQENGYQAGKCPARFDQALDIAFGKKDIYYQQPTRFYYPELPQIQFYDREAFPWLEALEEKTDAVCAELTAVMEEMSNFSPYLQSDPDAVNFNDTSNLDNEDWGAFYFYQGGRLVEDNAGRCPDTMSALAVAPLPEVEGSTPHALFSRLAGNTRIPPHNGLINTRLICHLPLLVPENCGGLRVGSQVQHWRVGEAYVFDDSIEHEAWNDSDKDRVVLLFDIWRPELSEDEKLLIAAMLTAVQGYENEV
jgi:aspartyl/asparaginyl beta-hydroxylase (cupin superfamily)